MPGNTVLLGMSDGELFAESLDSVLESAFGTTLGEATPRSRARTVEWGFDSGPTASLLAFGPGVMAFSVNRTEVEAATVERPERSTSVLATRLLGAHLLELTGASFASVASTSRGTADIGSLFFLAGSDGPFTEADVEELAARFSGTTVRTVERLPGALRFHQGAR